MKLTDYRNAMDVYKLANYFEIVEAEKLCESFIHSHTYPTNVCRIYEFNKIYNLQSIQLKCLQVN